MGASNTQPWGPRNNHWEWANPKFLSKYPHQKRHHKPEHVQVYSMRFMQYMESICKDEKLSACSEMFAPTVCFNLDWCTASYRGFDPRDLGDYSCDTRVGRSVAKDVCKKHDKGLLAWLL